MNRYEPDLLRQYLPQYYKRLFPYKPFVQWLSYGQKPSAYFAFREFAFIHEGDMHQRYQSFSDQVEFERELCRNAPFKLDIGAVFNNKPRDRKKYLDFAAIERELVFDIDLTDYDDIRKCCNGGTMCSKCWRWIIIAIGVLDRVLDEHFGFKHRLWVYSGRRGVHCWVADKRARQLTIAGRSAIADYLSLIGGSDSKRLTNERTKNVHPLLQTAYDTIMRSGHMDQLVLDQGWFDCEERWQNVLKLCTDVDMRRRLDNHFNNDQATAKSRWRLLKQRFDVHERANTTELMPEELDDNTAKWFLIEFVLQYAYPRLDINVSTGLNHLLKSPFCVHPKTGNIAVPLDVSILNKFDILTVPRIDLLVAELSKLPASDNNRKALDYKQTSLGPYVETFEAFVKALLLSSDSAAAAAVVG